MIEVISTDEFVGWLRGLRDRTAQKRISIRIARFEAGLLGDVKYFRGIGEARIDYGPGYRIYFQKRGNALIILLCGGDKSAQRQDIETAIKLAKDYA